MKVGRLEPEALRPVVLIPGSPRKTYFYPLSTDPSIARDPIPDFIIADVPCGSQTVVFAKEAVQVPSLAEACSACDLFTPRKKLERTDLTIRAKNPVTEWFEAGAKRNGGRRMGRALGERAPSPLLYISL